MITVQIAYLLNSLGTQTPRDRSSLEQQLLCGLDSQARVPPAARSASRGERPERLVWLQGLFCASTGVAQRREERAPI